MLQQRLTIILSALILAVLASIGSTTIASGHTFVIGSDPIDGSTMSTVPERVRIFFNASISPLSTASVYSIQDGKLVDVTAAPNTIPSNNPRELDLRLKNPGTLPQGSYQVRWTAISQADGHTTHGLIGFNIGFSSMGLSGTPTLGPSTSNNLYGEQGVRVFDFVNLLSIAWDWLVLMALTFWIGILVMEQLVLAGIDRTVDLLDRVRKQTHSLQSLCLMALLFGEIVALTLRTSRMAHATGGTFNLEALLQLLVETNYGSLWLVRIITIIIALGLLPRTKRPEQRASSAIPVSRGTARTAPIRQRNTQASSPGHSKNITTDQPTPALSLFSLAQHYVPIWLLLGNLLILTYVLSGDAIQVLRPQISAVVFDWLRYMAQGICFGGLTYLAYILLPHLSVLDRDHHAETLVAVQRRFTPYYSTAIGILLISTLFLSEASLSNVQQLLHDPYGRTLLLQIILIIIIFLMSLHTLFVLAPRATRQALLLPVVGADLPARRTRQFVLENTGRTLKLIMSIQSCLSTAVLFCTALMTFYAPPIVFPNTTSTNPPIQISNQVTPESRRVADLSVTLQIMPAKVMQENTALLTIKDRNGDLVTDAELRLIMNMQAMDMGTSHVTIKGGRSVYATTLDKSVFSMTGVWYIDVSIQRPKQTPLQTRFHVTII